MLGVEGYTMCPGRFSREIRTTCDMFAALASGEEEHNEDGRSFVDDGAIAVGRRP